MGFGDFGNGHIKLRVSFGYHASAADIDAWKGCLKQASLMLFNATEGTAQFKEITILNDGAGEMQADMWIAPYGEQSYFNSEHLVAAGGFLGYSDVSVTLAESAVDSPFTVLHEFGHYAFGLGDEYFDANGDAQCTALQQVVAAPGSGNLNTERACIMGAVPVVESGISSVDPQFGWINEFCSDANHVHNPGSSQGDLHGPKSCAAVIREAIFPATIQLTSGLQAKFDPHLKFDDPQLDIDWVFPDDESETVVVVDDASYGLGFGAAAGAGTPEALMDAANYWMEAADGPNDSSTLIAYGASPPHLPSPAQPSLDHALEAAAKTVTSRSNPAATQTIVLFSTGQAGARPLASRAKDLASAGIRVLTVGLGQDRAELQVLARGTKGEYYEVNRRHDVEKVRDDVMSLADELRFGAPILRISSDSRVTRKQHVPVEAGTKRVKFVLSQPRGANLRLSATPVHGHPADPSDDNVTVLDVPDRPYTTFTIDAPQQGDWVVGIDGANDVPFTLTAYGENPQIRVGVSGAHQVYRRGDEVTLNAVVSCPVPVVGLANPIARVVSPKGKKTEHSLKPQRGGAHVVSFKVDEPGAYEVELVFRNKGDAKPVGVASDDVDAFNAAFEIPEFERTKRVRVHVS